MTCLLKNLTKTPKLNVRLHSTRSLTETKRKESIESSIATAIWGTQTKGHSNKRVRSVDILGDPMRKGFEDLREAGNSNFTHEHYDITSQLLEWRNALVTRNAVRVEKGA